MGHVASVATEIGQLGQALSGNILAWGAAAIGLAVAAAGVMWVKRLLS